MANLIFLRQLKEIAQANEPDYTGNDAKYMIAIESASKTIEKLLGRELTKKQYTEILDFKRNFAVGYDLYGMGWSGYTIDPKPIPIPLKGYPIDPNETITVWYDPCQVFGDNNIIDSSDYYIDYDMGILYLYRAYSGANRALKIVYTAGYEATVDTDANIVYDPAANPPQEQALANTLPPDLFQAALIQAWHVFDKMTISNINVKYQRGEGSTNTTAFVNVAGVAPEAMAICAMNKRPRIAVV
jgi:hypothetical protein